jgi:outer membrane protein OmpA-like peptidoglycan-associated protein/tetratricopeptide (TPR) repeat protein
MAGYSQKISPKVLKKRGDMYYENLKYGKALPYYIKYQDAKPKDLRTKLRIGICYFETNRVEQAETYLEYMVQQRKPKPEALYYLARSYHMQHRFQEAIQFYKKYLATLDAKDNQKYPIKDNIRRCAMGKRLIYLPKLALVENLGDKVNTSGDDFAPTMHPDKTNILYFSSLRSGNLGERQNDFGIIDTLKGTYRADIFQTQLSRGEWGLAERLSSDINTEAHDIIYDFNEAGDRIYFGVSKYRRFDYSNIYSKPFYEKEKSLDIPFKFPIEINSGEWDADAYFVNDSTVIFSSDRMGGYGGKDLYISFRGEGGKWGEAINMGQEINTPYDEITPFVARNGKILYYSSNNITGMGGFDIYRTKFEPTSGWEKPHNLGIPINSAGDDTYFKISKDGMRAYFSSSRADGYGGADIYVGYLKRIAGEQTTLAQVNFKDFLEGDLVISDDPITDPDPDPRPDKPIEPETDVKSYAFAPIFYQDYANLLPKPESVREINRMKDLLIRQTSLIVELTSHTDSYGPQNYNLQSSVRSAESIADYLIANGIKPERIRIKGCGQVYPIAKDTNSDGTENKQGRTLNRRVQMEVYGEEKIPLIVKTKIPDISARLGMTDGQAFMDFNQGLTYRVQIKALKKMLDDDILIRYPDAMIETQPKVDIMRYSLGLFKTYNEAEALRQKLVAEGYTDAFVNAYINGEKMNKSDLTDYVGEYADLTNFLEDK